MIFASGHLLLLYRGTLCGVLVWVRGLVFENLDEFVESRCYNRAEYGADPVN